MTKLIKGLFGLLLILHFVLMTFVVWEGHRVLKGKAPLLGICQWRHTFQKGPFCRFEFHPLTHFPPELITDVIFVEDRSFFLHAGFDFQSLKQAWKKNQESGKIMKGGSTITQQLAKSLFLYPDRTWVRKYGESVITLVLETFFSKNQILELYLNTIELGPGVMGLVHGSQHHFTKELSRLTEEERMALVSLIVNPLRYKASMVENEPALKLRYDLLKSRTELDDFLYGLPQDFKDQYDYERLCSWDPNCDLLKEEGKFKVPGDPVITLVKNLRPQIFEAARVYEIDPRALIGVLLAEHTLNTSYLDEIQDALLKLKAPGMSQAPFTFGIGQVNPSAVWRVEEMAAKREKRKVRDHHAMANDLLDPQKALLSMAAILRDAQEAYRSKDYDISQRIDILLTLYNTGQAWEKIQLKTKGEVLRPNFFGHFYHLHQPLIESLAQPQ